VLSRRALLVLGASLAAVGLLGVVLVPSPAAGLLGVVLVPAPAVLWTMLIGIGLGTTFTLGLTLPTDIGADPGETGGAAALMLLVGYGTASVAPFVLGAVRDATGDFALSLWVLVGIAVAMIPVAWFLAPSRLRPPGHGAGGPPLRQQVPAAEP
jgi:MFS transporter, CP family, cyanate transporter